MSRTWVDRLSSFFPTELPDRPQKTPKLSFTKRLAHKWTPQIVKRKKSVVISQPLLSRTSAPATIASSALPSEDSGHRRVFNYQQSAPTPLGTTGTGYREPLQNQDALTRAGLSSSLAGPRSPEGNRGPLPHQVSHHAPAFAEPTTLLHSMQVKRKDLPPLSSSNTATHPVVERFERLKLLNGGKSPTTIPPTAGVSNFSSQSTPNFSPPHPFHSDSIATAHLVRNRTGVSEPMSPTPREESQILPRRQNTNPYRRMLPHSESGVSGLITSGDERDAEALVVSNNQTSAFSQTNFFQSGEHGKSYRQYRRPSGQKGVERRSRSPHSSSSSSEDKLSPRNPGISLPDLTARAAQAEIRKGTYSPPPPSRAPIIDIETRKQEEEDRRLAQRLQQEEDDSFDTVQLLLFEEMGSTVPHQKPTLKNTSRRTNPFSNLKRSMAHHGTQKNPIDLISDSDSDTQRELALEMRMSEGQGPLYGELMDLDHSDFALDEKGPSLEICQMVQEDAEIARLLQAQENWSQGAPSGNRDCAVCSDNFPIVELPSLANCTHRPETCAGCYAEWITAQLRASSWREVKCPGSECKIQLTYHEIQLYANPEIFQQYDVFIARAAFNEDRKFDHLNRSKPVLKSES